VVPITDKSAALMEHLSARGSAIQTQRIEAVKRCCRDEMYEESRLLQMSEITASFLPSADKFLPRIAPRAIRLSRITRLKAAENTLAQIHARCREALICLDRAPVRVRGNESLYTAAFLAYVHDCHQSPLIIS
jgi:hypothetical protein